MKHPWHDVSQPSQFPGEATAVIEIPMGSKLKYELDKESGLLKVDRVLYSSVHYPANYGFLPKTYCDDKDPLDILVLGQIPVAPLCLMRAKPIGMLQMRDQDELDDKIIAVHIDDPEFSSYNSLEELPPHRMKEIKKFFEDYKSLENKVVVVDRFLPADKAREAMMSAIELYKTTFLP